MSQQQLQNQLPSPERLALLADVLGRLSSLCLAVEEVLREVAPELEREGAPVHGATLNRPVSEALDAQEAAVLCGISVSKWRQMDADGQCPAPIDMGTGRCPRWLRAELMDWLWRGAPPRVRWSAMRDASRRS